MQKEDYENQSQVFVQAIRYKRLRRLGTAKYSKGMNQFSDMFFIEFENTYLHALTPVPLSDPLTYIPGQSDPAIDWRRATDEGGMPEMKNQGDSASGWAFATVDALEFHYFRMKGNNRSRSCILVPEKYINFWTMSSMSQVTSKE